MAAEDRLLLELLIVRQGGTDQSLGDDLKGLIELRRRAREIDIVRAGVAAFLSKAAARNPPFEVPGDRRAEVDIEPVLANVLKCDRVGRADDRTLAWNREAEVAARLLLEDWEGGR